MSTVTEKERKVPVHLSLPPSLKRRLLHLAADLDERPNALAARVLSAGLDAIGSGVPCDG